MRKISPFVRQMQFAELNQLDNNNYNMFNFCCFGNKNKKGVKSIEIYNKDYKMLKGHTLPGLNKANLTKKEEIFQGNHVLASTPVSTKSFNSKQFASGQLEDHPRKTILKSQYDNLIQSFKGSDELWEDEDFPHNQNSWGDTSQTVVWKRITEVIPDVKFVQNNFSPSDIIQGKTGDCYFLSSLAGLAECPQRIIKIFASTSMNKNGIYMARLLHKGIFQEVVVDDYFPFSPKGQLLSAKPAGGDQIWVMILEKCWAKMYGSYKAIEGGFPNEVLRAISGAPTYHYEMTEAEIAADSTLLDNLWRKLVRSEQKKHIMCAGSISDDIQDLKKLGLVNGHAYTILQICEASQKLVKLRNPWGHKEWTGRASDRDSRFWENVDEETKKKIGFYDERGDDGIFFMVWQDFTTYFNMLDICYYEDNAHYYYHEETYQQYTPLFYEVEITGGTNTFILSQTSARERSLSQNISDIRFDDATLILARVTSCQGVQYVESSTSNVISDFCLTCRDLQPGKYVLISFIDGLEKQSKATLSIYSESKASLDKSKQYDNNFLKKVMINHASKSLDQQILNQSPLEWLCFGFIQESKIGYYVFHLDDQSATNLELEFDEKQYKNTPFTLLPEYRGKGKFKLTCKRGEEIAVLCKVYTNNKPPTDQSFQFPVPKISRTK